MKYIVDIEKFTKLCEGRGQSCTKCPFYSRFYSHYVCLARKAITDSPVYGERKTDREKILLEERLKHLLESRFIKSFDEIDYLTGKYKRDIKEADIYTAGGLGRIMKFAPVDIEPEPVRIKAKDIKPDMIHDIFKPSDMIICETFSEPAKAKEEKPDTVPGRVQGKLLASAMAAVFGQRIRDAIKEGGRVEYNFSSGIITIYGKTEDEKK